MRKALIGFALFLAGVAAAHRPDLLLPAGREWAHKGPADVGMDAAKLNDAVEFMKSHETSTPRRDFSDQELNMGKLLASMPTERGGSRASSSVADTSSRSSAIRCARTRPTALPRACSPRLRASPLAVG